MPTAGRRQAHRHVTFAQHIGLQRGARLSLGGTDNAVEFQSTKGIVSRCGIKPVFGRTSAGQPHSAAFPFLAGDRRPMPRMGKALPGSSNWRVGPPLPRQPGSASPHPPGPLVDATTAWALADLVV